MSAQSDHVPVPPAPLVPTAAAATDIENTAGIEAAVESFGQAVRAALQPPATRWARIRSRTR